MVSYHVSSCSWLSGEREGGAASSTAAGGPTGAMNIENVRAQMNSKTAAFRFVLIFILSPHELTRELIAEIERSLSVINL
jgi:hypothetical protein